MFKRQKSLRFVLIGIALIVFTALAFGLTGASFNLFGTATEAKTEKAAQPLTLGTCDTAGPIEIESSGGVTVPTAYATLGAAFTAINAGTHTGAIAVEVCGDSNELAVTATLNASGSGSASYAQIIISPAGGAARTISGTSVAGSPMIDFNGADNVNINGLNTGGNSLTISNNQTSTTANTSTIRYINDATGNTIQNANINGNALGASTGTIFYSNTTGTDGNDNNTVTNSNIGPVAATFPANGILSSGTTTSQTTRNSGIQITNNNIFDFFTNTAVIANGVLASAGTTDMTITGNSFYQTATRTMSVAASGFIGISIADTSSINNTISNNFIGGSTASAGGTAWTQTGAVTHTFIGIRMSVGTATPSSLQNNRIQNLSISTSTTSTINAGISAVTGAMNIGTTTGNTIGATTGTGSITWTGAGAGARFAGISAGTGTPGGINISNNNVGSITIAGAGTTVFYGIRMEGAATAAYTVSGNTIGSTTTANSITDGTNTTCVGISSSNTGFPVSATNNTVQNLQHTSTGTSASLRGIELLGSVSGQNIASNTIANFSSASTNTGTTGTASLNGIVLTGSSTSGNTITANTIRDLSNTAASAAVYANGITITSTPGTTMARNFIYNLTTASTSTTSSIQGIYLFNSAATENIYNNMIRLGTGVGNNPIIRGIRDNTATSSPTNIIHNSIFIDGTQGAATVNTNCIVRDLASTMTITDNILWNNRASTGAPGAQTGRHYGIQNTSTTGTFASNYNVIYAPNNGGAVGQSSSLDRITLGNWQTATSQDLNSYSMDPQFIDATNATTPNLHIHPTNATIIESNGTLVGAPLDDFDGQTRSGLTPVDIGADAGNFNGIDLAGPNITYTTLLNTSSTANRTLTATLTDNTGVATGGNSPRIYFKKSTDATFTLASSTACSLTSGTVNNGTWDCLINYTLVGGGSVTSGDTIQYFVVAQDTLGNLSSNPSAGFTGTNVNTVTTPPTTPNTYNIVNAISGSFNVDGVGGGAPNFASLTNAGGMFEYINNNEVAGNITINITTNITGELGTVALNEFASPFTILIKPTGGAWSVTGASTVSLIKLNGADRVRIDGSTAATFAEDVVGGTPSLRELTINNTSTGAVIWIATNANGGATNNTIRNNTLNGGGAFGGQGIIAGSGATFGAAAESGRPNSNNTVQNNKVARVQNAVFTSGDGTTRDQNWSITENDFGAALVADKLSFRGVLVSGADNFTISQNIISGVNSSTSTSSTMSGIQLAGVINGGTITRNQIKDIRQNNTTGWGSNGIYLTATSTASNVTIANNFISDIASQGFAGNEPADNGYGIVLEGAGGGFNIYHNTVVMGTNQVAVGSITAALLVDDSATALGALNVRNNIFVNQQTVGTQYAVYVDTPVTNGVFSAINYNDYFSIDHVGALPATNRTTLADWQTATGQDGFSQAVDPVLVSSTDFHLQQTSPLLGDGDGTTAVTNDFDGDPRPATAPDIGADEIVQSQAGVIPGGTYYNALGTTGDTLGGNVTITGRFSLTGIVSGGGNTLNMGCDAVFSGGSTLAFYDGAVAKTYCGPLGFIYDVGAGEYSPMIVTVTAGTFPSTLTVQTFDTTLFPFMPAQSLDQNWALTETGDLTANLQFFYQESDVSGTESDYRLYKRDTGSPVEVCGTACVDESSNIATINGQTSFSRWGIAGALQPTAASVNVGGRVTNATGTQGLPRVRVTLSGGDLAAPVERLTNPFGYYSFENLTVGQTYVITVGSKQYTFAAPSRVITPDDNIFNVDFFADWQ